ncbi:J domain-containing protein [Streptomyces incanus]|uniref:J domain-containing protein n=1 Tax=Streptomyces incanus TaxID=887453 RepID=A0ABW0XVD4_9ACTN
MQTRDRGSDLYAVLGAEPSATAGLITSAFRARVRELRPDTRVDATTAERFGEVRAAYETLRDPVRRAAYDQTCELARHRTQERGQALTRHAPPRRYFTVLQVCAPEPPLRAGPVHWKPMLR